MRSLIFVAIVTLAIRIRLNAAVDETNSESISDQETNSPESTTTWRLKARRIVTDLVSNFSSKCHTISDKHGFESGIYSPFGAFLSLLRFTFYGPSGTTRMILKEVLGLTQHETADIILGIRTLLDSFHKYTQVELRVSGDLYFPHDRPLSRTLVEQTKRYFHSTVDTFDPHDKSSTNAKINAWFAKQTNQSSTEFFIPDLIDAALSGIFVNALYFNGEWKTGFDASRPMLRYFYINDTARVLTKTMMTTGRFRYGEIPSLNITFVQLPYKSNGLDDGIIMTVLRFDSDDGHNKECTSQLFKTDVKQAILNSPETYVTVYLPKFKMQTIFPSESLIQSMGKAAIEVDERGTRNSEILGIFSKTRKTRSPQDRKKRNEFLVNRPFVAMVSTTGAYSIDLFVITVSGSTLVARDTNGDPIDTPRVGLEQFSG